MASGALLFRTSFTLLYLEVVLLRWVGAYVPFASFFTHHVLLGALLGVSWGYFLAPRAERLIHLAPVVLLGSMVATAGFHWLHTQSLLSVRVASSGDPERLFFGTLFPKDRHLDLPIEVTLLVIFVGTALLAAALGQRLGKRFEAAPRRIPAYLAHLAGCVAGVAAFAGLTALNLSPIWWWLPGLVLLGLETGTSSRHCLALVACIGPIALLEAPREGWERHWSPYNRVDHRLETGEVFANGIGHQRIADHERVGPAYALPHALCVAADGAPPERVLVIGAGTGNDVSAALASGASVVHAIEIDPVLARLGREHHPDAPYDDPRVTLILEDGRRYLQTTKEHYDLIVFGLVDSLTLHSSYGSVRLESYLFTHECFAFARNRLRPGGRLSITNYLRSGWLVLRFAALLEETFGAPPRVYTVPHQDVVRSAAPPDEGLTILMAGAPVAARLEVEGQPFAASELEAWSGPTPTDDWPYPYLRARRIPGQNLRALALLVGAALVLMRLVRAPLFAPGSRHFLFLGAGFALVETTSVTRLAVVYGTTWHVHAAVLMGVMGASLVGTLLAARWPRLGGRKAYLALGVCLLLSGLVDGGWLLSLPLGIPALVLFAPLICSGAIFTASFAACPSAARALGSNALGVLLGIALETLSVVTGLQGMIALVAVAYALSFPRKA